MPELTAERLRELLHYDPLTGVFTRRQDAMGGHRREQVVFHAGSAVGWLGSNGYCYITVGGRTSKKMLAHRLAWLYMTGEWPPQEIDHLNGQRADNRWANLRDSTRAMNVQNKRHAESRSISGVLGAHWNGRNWYSRIGASGRTTHLGTFPTPEEAHAAYITAKRKYHEGNTL